MDGNISFRDRSLTTTDRGLPYRWRPGLLLLLVALLAGSVLAAAAAPKEEADGSMMVVATPVATPVPAADLGDAPDSTNHPMANMRAYGGDTAMFPTVFDDPVPGPLHRNVRIYFLGAGVSAESEADRGFDADGVNNIQPLMDKPDNDNFDDAFGGISPTQPPFCQLFTLTFTITYVGNGPATTFFNTWYDANRNGRFGDTLDCDGTSTSEWALQNKTFFLPGPGTYTVTTPAFLVHNHGPGLQKPPMWMRITLSDQSAPANAADGRGPANGYALGETEDYLIPGISGPGN